MRLAARASQCHRIATKPSDSLYMQDRGGPAGAAARRQRIGIARALIRNSPILILDEPTAALDAESEHLVMSALQNLMRGRTVITIAHRLSTIRDAHKIVVLEEGRVVEEGTHGKLLALGGRYAELHRIQYESETP